MTQLTRGTIVFAAVGLLAFPSLAQAHALGAEAKLKDGTVYVEAFFDDDSAAIDAKIHVEDEAKKVVAEGRTDKKGRWSFPAPAAGKYRVIVDAGAGHRASVGLTIPGVAATTAPSAPPPDQKKAEELVVSDGTRSEFTGIPWLKVAIGLGVVSLVGIAAALSLRKPNTQVKEATK